MAWAQETGNPPTFPFHSAAAVQESFIFNWALYNLISITFYLMYVYIVLHLKNTNYLIYICINIV